MKSKIHMLLNLFPASVLFGLLLVYTSKLHAQLPVQDQVPSREVVSDYIPMAVEGSYWHYIESMPMIWRNMYGIVIAGDTMVDNLRWKKLWEVRFEVENIVGHNLLGFIRDDIPLRTVMVKPLTGRTICGDSGETVLYDFNLSPGDTITDCISENAGFHRVESVSIISMDLQTIDFSYRFELPFSTTKEYLIAIDSIVYVNKTYKIYEGIGSNIGIFPLVGMLNDFSATELLFCHGSNPGCSWMRPTSTDGIKIALPLRAYPNPTSTRLTLAWDVPLPAGTITVLDAAGRVVLETPLPPGATEYETDVAHLPAGVYVARVGASVVRWVRN